MSGTLDLSPAPPDSKRALAPGSSTEDVEVGEELIRKDPMPAHVLKVPKFFGFEAGACRTSFLAMNIILSMGLSICLLEMDWAPLETNFMKTAITVSTVILLCQICEDYWLRYVSYQSHAFSPSSNKATLAKVHPIAGNNKSSQDRQSNDQLCAPSSDSISGLHTLSERHHRPPLSFYVCLLFELFINLLHCPPDWLLSGVPIEYTLWVGLRVYHAVRVMECMWNYPSATSLASVAPFDSRTSPNHRPMMPPKLTLAEVTREYLLNYHIFFILPAVMTCASILAYALLKVNGPSEVDDGGEDQNSVANPDNYTEALLMILLSMVSVPLKELENLEQHTVATLSIFIVANIVGLVGIFLSILLTARWLILGLFGIKMTNRREDIAALFTGQIDGSRSKMRDRLRGANFAGAGLVRGRNQSKNHLSHLFHLQAHTPSGNGEEASVAGVNPSGLGIGSSKSKRKKKNRLEKGQSGSSSASGSSRNSRRVRRSHNRRRKTTAADNPFTDRYGHFVLAEDMPLLHGRYKILSFLGQGTFSKLFKAQDQVTGRIVALKIINSRHSFIGIQEYSKVSQLTELEQQMIADQQQQQQEEDQSVGEDKKALNELQNAYFRSPRQDSQRINNEINHDQIIQTRSSFIKFFDKFVFYGHYIIVAEILGPSLLDVIRSYNKRNKRLSMDNIRKLTYQMCRSLAFLRQAKLLHTDIKPENILFEANSTDPRLKLIDFGNAVSQKDTVAYMDDFLLQTIYYRAPEVVLGVPFSYPIDMWSLGCVIVELLIGRPLFYCSNNADLFSAIMALLGPFPAGAYHNAKFKGKYLRQTSMVNTRQDHRHGYQSLKALLPGNSPDSLVSLLLGLLALDPAIRLTATEAMRHPFFTPILDAKVAAVQKYDSQTASRSSNKLDTLSSHPLPGSSSTSFTPATSTSFSASGTFAAAESSATPTESCVADVALSDSSTAVSSSVYLSSATSSSLSSTSRRQPAAGIDLAVEPRSGSNNVRINVADSPDTFPTNQQ